ncbi:hypothetical protein [Halobaculum marinum]|uniref:Transcriptional initiation protein Tat n=1 Tax=Halobaculum marinum TaxID=3031996 RepID=A0ABD5WWC9_9EURY|nr:hypothetical protein [Halobaculum sp. DT55]
MKRRRLLGSLARAAVAGGVVATAGCTSPASPSGPLTPPRSPEGGPNTGEEGLVIRDFLDVEGDDGALLVRVTVENRAGEERSGTVVVTATAGSDDDEREVSTSESITVPAGERVEVTLETSLTYEEFSRQGSMRVDVTES